jgi:hypothetical protein
MATAGGLLARAGVRPDPATMEPPGAVREAFERDGFYIFRNILDSSALAAPQRQLEEKVEAMASALRAARAEARAPPRSSHADAPFASRWARLAQAFAQDCRAGLVPTDKLALISSGSWGRTDMLDPRVHALLTHEPLLEVAKLLLGDEVTVNGDYYFRPAVSDTIVDWGLEYHQDSFNYGGDIHARPLRPQVEGLQVLTLWLPLVPVDETSGALSLVKGSHRRGKIWPATIAPADRDPQRQTTFSDLVPRPPVAQRQAAGAGAAVEQPYSSENWPDGVGLYGEVVAPSLQPGDVRTFFTGNI